MSAITERLMRGDHLTREDCMEHADQIHRTLDAYPKAMSAMREHERRMRDCICGADVEGRIPVAGCPVHAEENQD